MTEMLGEACARCLRFRVEQDSIASQITETLQDEASWTERLQRGTEKLRRLAEDARQERSKGKSCPLDELF